MKRGALVPLAELLAGRGEFSDAETAARWILAGQVFVDGHLVTKSRMPVRRDAAIVVKGREKRFVSRGGVKLEWALERFRLPVEGMVVLDAGAASGGFTDCLLQRGASRVYAVDVGYGQMVGRLAADPRVVSLERTNISDLSPGDFDPPLDLAVVDLSYLSLTKALPIVARLFAKPVRIVALIKPLFEGARPDVKDDAPVLTRVLLDLQSSLAASGLPLVDLTGSPVRGTQGTIEFLGLVDPAREPAPNFRDLVDAALAESMHPDERVNRAADR